MWVDFFELLRNRLIFAGHMHGPLHHDYQIDYGATQSDSVCFTWVGFFYKVLAIRFESLNPNQWHSAHWKSAGTSFLLLSMSLNHWNIISKVLSLLRFMSKRVYVSNRTWEKYLRKMQAQPAKFHENSTVNVPWRNTYLCVILDYTVVAQMSAFSTIILSEHLSNIKSLNPTCDTMVQYAFTYFSSTALFRWTFKRYRNLNSTQRFLTTLKQSHVYVLYAISCLHFSLLCRSWPNGLTEKYSLSSIELSSSARLVCLQFILVEMGRWNITIELESLCA